ncbi:hypothetical protein PQE75_gp067 [Bacillus phage vB_BcoS-136]|uniref:Uncharacterized protein n=1 Tax=Bacillus phage vB_BcoS-136 TaxID=2419619 RepID=A0A3G3BVC1_9CAUD|nr:hypothetical protein PQE75_gp067 [Bacillus phage vB_BcoS-136]AYP68199.1 hypothetical protein vBBcoS136_00067 [Bacillus phage vB_BcoS-136]
MTKQEKKEAFLSWAKQNLNEEETKAIQEMIKLHKSVIKVYSDVDKRFYSRRLRGCSEGFYIVLNGSEVLVQPTLLKRHDGTLKCLTIWNKK